jgi:photosystem II stability/assembly factor-like uncharacterized protein
MAVRRTSSALLCLSLVWVAAGGALRAQTSGWSSVGPEGGTAYTLVIDPQNAATIYAGTEQGGVFKSTDRGEHWSPINAGLPQFGDLEFGGPYVQALAVNPQESAVLYAGVATHNFFFEPIAYGVFRSDDRGGSWHAVNAGIEERAIHAIAIDPQTPTTLYASGSAGVPIGSIPVFKSTDGGASWTALGLSGSTVSLLIDPQVPAIVYAGGWGGVSKTTDGGATWTAMNDGLTFINVSELALDPNDSTVIYAATRGGGVFKSVAGGAWTNVSAGLTSLEVTALAIDPQTTSTLYAGTTTAGVFKSTDGGTTWVPVNAGLTAAPVNSLAIDVQSPATVYAGSSRRGVFKSDDGASRWRLTAFSNVRALSLAANPSGTVIIGDDFGGMHNDNGEGGWHSFDLQNRNKVNAVAVDPLNASIVYGATSSGGVYKSTDGGAGFTRMLAGGFLSFAIDPVASSTLYAGGGPVEKSVDAGATWTQHTSGLSGSRMTSLIVDPQNPTTLYAVMSGRVFKSETGGTTWVGSDAGMAGLAAQVLAADPLAPTTLYAGMFDAGVFKSVDGGASWAPANAGLSDRLVTALAVDPQTPSTVYAGTFGAGVFRSTDGGATWTAFNTGLGGLLIRSLAIVAESSALYAGTDGAGVFAMSTTLPPPPQSVSLRIRVSGHGSVSMTSDPAGIDCGRDCRESFPMGTIVTLTATADRGTITDWKGCDSDSGPGPTSTCTVSMDSKRRVEVRVEARAARRHRR